MSDLKELRLWVEEIRDSNKGLFSDRGVVAQTFCDAALAISVQDPVEILEAGLSFQEMAKPVYVWNRDPSMSLVYSMLSDFCLWDGSREKS